MVRIPAINQVDQFIGDLYRARQSVESRDFKGWALENLKDLIPFDAALWGTGNVESRKFHSISIHGLPEDYAHALEETQDKNPILPALLKDVGKAIPMSAVFPDKQFYKSDLYLQCFKRYGVERILSVVEADNRSGIYTLISLYRFDRKKKFTRSERATQQRCGYHLVNAASHAFFSHLHSLESGPRIGQTAICDAQGIFHEVQPLFLDKLDEHFPNRSGNRLPFRVPNPGKVDTHGELKVESNRFADLYMLRIWEPSPLDQLTERERNIAEKVSQGLTFKEIGKALNLAPSTVSNHMYRVYKKLGIASRSALANLVHGKD